MAPPCEVRSPFHADYDLFRPLPAGDTSKIKIGSETSIGDRAVINVPDFKLRIKQEFPDTVIGNRVTIGMNFFYLLFKMTHNHRAKK